MDKVNIPSFEHEVLKDVNGKVVRLGDSLSFGGAVAKVIWWEEQGRFYFDFGNGNLFEATFYTWIHGDFEVVEEEKK